MWYPDFGVQIPRICRISISYWSYQLTLILFLAGYYNCLPDTMIVAHPHNQSYHKCKGLDWRIKNLRWDNVPGCASLHPDSTDWAEFNPYDPVSDLKTPMDLSLLKIKEDEIDCVQVAHCSWHSTDYSGQTCRHLLEACIELTYALKEEMTDQKDEYAPIQFETWSRV